MGNYSVTWRTREVDEALAAANEAAGEHPLVARLLAARGIGPDGLEAFYDPSVARLMRPQDLPGIDAAVRVILPFLGGRRKIVVFGDYDVDGVCASAILVSAVRRLSPSTPIDAFVPLRVGEGYGMTEASLARLYAEHPDVALVVTVDCGVTTPDEVAELRGRGVAVVVTDHHLPGERLPEADALVNPRVASCPGCEELCGAGVAFFLASALAKAATDAGLYAGAKFGGPLLVLAGLATVADLMSVTGQNRVLVSQSLAFFNRCAPIGLRELLARAARSSNALVARDYGFTLSPRINAAGRMETARIAFDLLMCEESDRETARLLASRVEGLNGERRGIEADMFRDACEQVAAAADLRAVVVRGADRAADPVHGWHLGVAGIVASRLQEKYHVPVAVAVGDTGSARAPDGFNVHDALTAATGHLVRFGGHAAAGGFTVRPGEFEAFREVFTAACAAKEAAAQKASAIAFDGWVEPADLTLDLHRLLCRLEPFGEGNPEPVFGLRGVHLEDVGVIGQEGRHLSLSFVNHDIPRAVWWAHGEDAEKLRAASSKPHDVLFTLTSTDFGTDLPHAELRLVAIRPS